MTAFIGMISKDFAIMGTDTLCTYPRPNEDSSIKPRSYSCKTFHLPQFKSAFSVTGTLQVGLCFYNLIVESAYGVDVNSLVNIGTRHLFTKLSKDYEEFPEGAIYLLGFSETAVSFKGFELPIVKSHQNPEWETLPLESLIFKPGVPNWEDLRGEKDRRINNTELIVDLMTIQKQEDELKPIREKVGIGGNIVVTHMNFMDNGNLLISTEMASQFDDFIELGNKMAKQD